MAASYSINFTVTVPPIALYSIRVAQNTTDPVVWAFIDTNGCPVILTGKSLSLTAYLDTGATQVTQFSHTTSTGLAITQNEVTWTPQSMDTQVAQILKYLLVNTTDGQELAWGSLSVFPA